MKHTNFTIQQVRLHILVAPTSSYVLGPDGEILTGRGYGICRLLYDISAEKFSRKFTLIHHSAPHLLERIFNIAEIRYMQVSILYDRISFK